MMTHNEEEELVIKVTYLYYSSTEKGERTGFEFSSAIDEGRADGVLVASLPPKRVAPSVRHRRIPSKLFRNTGGTSTSKEGDDDDDDEADSHQKFSFAQLRYWVHHFATECAWQPRSNETTMKADHRPPSLSSTPSPRRQIGSEATFTITDIAGHSAKDDAVAISAEDDAGAASATDDAVAVSTTAIHLIGMEYIDNEGDWIEFSTDEELNFAIRWFGKKKTSSSQIGTKDTTNNCTAGVIELHCRAIVLVNTTKSPSMRKIYLSAVQTRYGDSNGGRDQKMNYSVHDENCTAFGRAQTPPQWNDDEDTGDENDRKVPFSKEQNLPNKDQKEENTVCFERQDDEKISSARNVPILMEDEPNVEIQSPEPIEGEQSRPHSAPPTLRSSQCFSRPTGVFYDDGVQGPDDDCSYDGSSSSSSSSTAVSCIVPNNVMLHTSTTTNSKRRRRPSLVHHKDFNDPCQRQRRHSLLLSSKDIDEAHHQANHQSTATIGLHLEKAIERHQYDILRLFEVTTTTATMTSRENHPDPPVVSSKELRRLRIKNARAIDAALLHNSKKTSATTTSSNGDNDDAAITNSHNKTKIIAMHLAGAEAAATEMFVDMQCTKHQMRMTRQEPKPSFYATASFSPSSPTLKFAPVSSQTHSCSHIMETDNSIVQRKRTHTTPPHLPHTQDMSILSCVRQAI